MHRFLHDRRLCLYCWYFLNLVPVLLHGLEYFGLSVHGLEQPFEAWAAALTPYVTEEA